MAVELATAYVSLVPSARNITSGLQKELTGPTNAIAGTAGAKAGKTFGSKFGGAVRTLGKASLFGLAGLAVGAGKILFNSIGAAEESIKVAKQTAAVISSTGGAAKISAAQVETLATSLSNKAGIDDELITSGANVLLTFTNIRNEVGAGNDIFNQATGLALDMSVALGTDLSSANIQLGKALNDPIKGITALSRVGVSFTQQQKDQIAALVESGDLLGAQKIILAELSREFSGSAEAQATASGKMSVAFGNLQEQIGGLLLPAVEAFSTWMTEKGIPAISQLADWVQLELFPALKEIGIWIGENVIPAFQAMGEAFNDLSPNVRRIVLVIGAAAAILGVLIVTFGALPIAIAAVVAGVIYAYNHFETFRDIVDGVIRWITDTAVPAIQNFAQSFIDTFNGISESTTHTMNVIQDVIGATLTVISFLWNTFGQTILGYVKAVWQTIYGIISGFLQVISGIIKTVLAVINGDWGKAWEGIKQIFQGFVTTVRGILGGFLTFVKAAIGNTLKIIKDLWSDAWGAVGTTVTDAANAIVRTIVGWKDRLIGIFSNAVTWLLQAGRNIISGLWSGIKWVYNNSLLPWFVDLPNKIKNFVSNSVKWLFEGGKNILRGLKSGIIAIWGDVIKWFKDIPGKILDAIGIKSPPKWAVSAGRWVMRAFTKGLGLGVGSALDFLGKLASKFTGPLKAAWDDVYGVVSGVVGAVFGGGGFGFGGLQKNLAERIKRMINMSGGKIYLISGRRSHESQIALYNEFLARGKQPPLVARPGTSKHERGLAADLGGPYGLMAQLAHSVGLVAPVPGEPWHWELPSGRRSLYAKGSWNVPRGGGYTHAGEMVLPARLAGAVRSALAGGAGGTGTYVAPGAVVIGIPPGASMAEAQRLGTGAGKAFLDVLAQRRVVTDARIA